MLRITVHDDEAGWRMQLEGKLAGAWVKQAADAWQAAKTSGRTVEIDLTGVTVVDAAGVELLQSMKQAGAHFQAKGVEMKALVGEMAGSAECKWVRHLFGAVLLAAVIGTNSVQAQQTAAAPLRLTLKQAVVLALRQNPQVAIANLNLAESQENLNAARSGLLPQASFGASEQVNRQNVAALLGERVPGFPGHTGPFWVVEAGG